MTQSAENVFYVNPFHVPDEVPDIDRFTVYGFLELGKRMRAMVMLVMIESITAKIKYNQSDGVATWVYVDEMHELWGEEYSLHASNAYAILTGHGGLHVAIHRG